MAQLDGSDENSRGLSSSIIGYLHHPVTDLTSQIQTMWREPRSIGFSHFLETNTGFSHFQETNIGLSPLVETIGRQDYRDLGESSDSTNQPEESRAAQPVDEDGLSFNSKYFTLSPLYQDYCLQAVRPGWAARDDLHSLSNSFVPELIIPQYVRPLLSIQGEEREGPLLPPTVVPQSSFWQDLDKVKASGLLGSLTIREIRCQESMFELMSSEASYLKSLEVAINHFYASESLRQTLSPMEHRILFSNIVHVRTASEKFLTDLEICLGEGVLISQVGDNVLRHCSEFRCCYVPYVTNMKFQEALMNQQKNRDFLSTIKMLETDPVCQRKSLKSFLILPFQRITRLKLILQAILKLTEQGSDSILNLENAIEAIHEIVTECDEGIRKMKQMAEMVSLDAQLDFSRVKSFPLVVSGRFLVHEGKLRQRVVDGAHGPKISFIGVHLHLFNNLLIISSKRFNRFSVVDHAVFPTHVHLEHMKNESPHSFLLRLSQSGTGQPTAMKLVAYKSSDKEGWMKALSSKW